LIKQLLVETHILKVALRQAVHPEDLSIPLWHWGNLRLADDLLNEGNRDGQFVNNWQNILNYLLLDWVVLFDLHLLLERQVLLHVQLGNVAQKSRHRRIFNNYLCRHRGRHFN
jgi:hypothetical protein